MRWLYTAGIFLYTLAIRLAAPFNKKAKEWLFGRKNFFHKLPDLQGKPVLWFHCASLGEFDMAIPVMNELRNQHPDHLILVTFFSPSGMLHYHKRQHPADLVVYLPADTPKNAKRFVQYFNPEKVFFVKYEFWVNYLFALKETEAKVFSMCTLLRADQRFFRWYGGFFRKSLELFDHFYVQNETTKELLRSIGINTITVTGDTRYDKVLETKNKQVSNARIDDFLGGEKAVIFGSTWPEDEAMILPWVAAHPTVKCIIAPHNIDAAHIQTLKSALGNSCECYTEAPKHSAQVLILDTIGHLSSAYVYAQLAYVGGGFSGKLHNILEPGVYGIPVLFGPKFSRFPEAEQFIKTGIGFSVANSTSLADTINEVSKRFEDIQLRAYDFIQKNAGAAARIAEHQSTHFKHINHSN
jgi:3-deoxy-D-manno-octulosonic-acid transferase